MGGLGPPRGLGPHARLIDPKRRRQRLLRSAEGAAPLIQLHGFSQGTGAGGGIIGPPVAVATTLTALAQGKLDALVGNGNIHSDIGDAAAQAGYGYRNDNGPVLDRLIMFYRAAGSTLNLTHTFSGGNFVGDGTSHVFWVTLDTAPAQEIGIDAESSSTAQAAHLTGTPTTTPKHKLGTNFDTVNFSEFTGMQFAIVDRVLGDPDEAAGRIFAEFYNGDADLASSPVPEAGLLADTPLDDIYWRDEDAEVNRSTVATANDGGVVGTPYSDWASGYKTGGDAWSDTDYVTLAAGQLAGQTPVGGVTLIAKVTTPAAYAGHNHVVAVRDIPGADGFAMVIQSSGVLRVQSIHGASSNQLIDTVSVLATATVYWLVAKWDVDTPRMTAQIYDAAGVQVDTRASTHADTANVTFPSTVIGRGANAGNSNDGTIHEMRVYDGEILADAEITSMIDGSDLGEVAAKRTRRFVGFSAGVRDMARATALYIPEIRASANPPKVARVAF